MSTSGSRLAMVANQRRRQRKQQQAALKNGSEDSSQTSLLREDRQGKAKFGHTKHMGLACAPTASTTFDDSTISSNTSTITADTFNFVPPAEILSPPTKSVRGTNRAKKAATKPKLTVKASSDAVEVVSTPKRRNAAFRSRFGGSVGASSSKSDNTISTMSGNTKSTSPPKPTPPKLNETTPKNSNLSYGSNRFRNRRGKLSAPSEETRDNSKITISAAKEQIRLLTAERDSLKEDVTTYKQQLGKSKSHVRNATLSAGDAANKMATLTNQVEDLTKQLELSKSKSRIMEVEAREDEQRMVAEHIEQMNALEQRLDERDEEMGKLITRNNVLEDAKNDVEGMVKTKERELRRELENVQEERDRVEGDWKECVEKLERLEKECENKYEQHAQRESQLEQSIQELQKERRSSLSDQRGVEKGLRDEISDLQEELSMQRSSVENVKRHHATIVEGIKSDLANARKLREESATSLQRDMDAMRKEHNESERYYKEEVESLRSQLRNVKGRADADRKEKGSLSKQLAQAQKDIECLKSVRDKDIDLLESELDKTYKSKVELEVELKDAKRGLNNALRNLDEMATDGGKMRTDLEGVMSDFTNEKQHYQKEINELRSSNVEQKSKITDLTRENERLVGDCHGLKQKVQSLEDRCLSLEDRLMEEMKSVKSLEEKLKKEATKSGGEWRKHQRHDDEDNKNRLLLDLQYMKSKLKKAEEEAASAKAQLASTSQSEQSELEAKITQLKTEKLQLTTQMAQNTESMEAMRHSQRETSADLSRAQQTIQILKSKERYLESRVESLANQISKTVQDYEMRLSISASTSSESGRGGGRVTKLSKSGSEEGSVGSSKFGDRK